MGRHVAGDMPELDRLVEESCAAIGAEIDALRIPRLAGVVLGGGYGRGEGGAIEKLESKVGVGEGKSSALELQLKTPTFALSNDLDFFAITEDGVPEAETVASIAAALEPVSKRWTERLGVDVDFAVKTPWRLKHDEDRLMVQELVHGYYDVAGCKGEELFAGIARREPSELPVGEATRLLMNRGMGLLLAKSKDGWSSKLELENGTIPLSNSELELCSNFVNRNINKCVLGAGDARLIAAGEYRWKAEDRAAALGDALYASAVEWKFRPRAFPVCNWETARTIWLAAEDDVGKACSRNRAAGRTLRNALRWLVRRRTLGDISTFGLAPETRVLRNVAAAIRGYCGMSPALRRDWEVFN